MFPYDPALLAAAHAVPQTVPDLLQTMHAIDAILPETDGLKWFHGLYLRVSEAIAERVAAAGFSDPAWMAALDVQFVRLYLNALADSLGASTAPACWQALFDRRADTRIARIQFALAGMNAHINHDLPTAIVNTCHATGVAPDRGVHYADYTAVDTTLAGLIETAKRDLNVRLLGDPLPPISHLEDTLAAFNLDAAREAAWNGAEILWVPLLAPPYLRTLEGWPTVIAKTLLAAVPV